MAKNVIINGVVYSDVPYVEIPNASGTGKSKFVDSVGTASTLDIKDGETAWVNGIQITGSAPIKTASDLTVSGKTVTAPAGFYESSVEKSIADGSITLTASVDSGVIGASVTAYPITISPSATVEAGYISGNQNGTDIVKYIQTESKTATPAVSSQDIVPSNGKLLTKVTVSGVDVTATATEADVLNGKTFFSGNLVRKTGTARVPVVSQDSSSKVLTIT